MIDIPRLGAPQSIEDFDGYQEVYSAYKVEKTVSALSERIAELEEERVARDLTQQAKGISDYIKHIQGVTEIINQTDINCSENYIMHLLNQAKEQGE